MLHKITLALLLALFTASPAFSQKDKIEGQWYNAEKTAKIQIYLAKDNKYWGKIVWLKEPLGKDGKPRVDEHNTTESQRSRPLLNLPLLKAFEKKGDDTYTNGTIYDPKNGKTYSCTITYRSDKELGIRGYVGISLIGRTTTWTRAE